MSSRTRRFFAVLACLGALLFLALFDIDLAPRFSLPHDEMQADPQQEERYQQCFDARDAGIHERAFGTIDNPDVQREYIIAHRNAAEAACREEFPRQQVAVHKSLDINLVDVSLRHD